MRAATHALTLQRPLLGPHAGHLFHLAYGHGVTMQTHASSQRANAASRSEAAVASASFFSAASQLLRLRRRRLLRMHTPRVNPSRSRTPSAPRHVPPFGARKGPLRRSCSGWSYAACLLSASALASSGGAPGAAVAWWLRYGGVFATEGRPLQCELFLDVHYNPRVLDVFLHYNGCTLHWSVYRESHYPGSTSNKATRY